MKEKWVAFTEKHAEIWKFIKFTFTGASTSVLELAVFAFLQYVVFKSMNTTPVTDNAVLHFLGIQYRVICTPTPSAPLSATRRRM